MKIYISKKNKKIFSNNKVFEIKELCYSEHGSTKIHFEPIGEFTSLPEDSSEVILKPGAWEDFTNWFSLHSGGGLETQLAPRELISAFAGTEVEIEKFLISSPDEGWHCWAPCSSETADSRFDNSFLTIREIAEKNNLVDFYEISRKTNMAATAAAEEKTPAAVGAFDDIL